MPKPQRVKKSRPKQPIVVEPLREVEVTPLNRQQDAALRAVARSSISFLLGPAGTGKTHLACGYAAKCVADGRFEKIILTRPIVEAGESLGYLPGTYEEKAAPYLLPIHDSLDAVAGRTGRRREQLRAMLQVAPIAYLRGRTFNRSVIIVDESQNCTLSQLKLVISRLGRDSQMILTGDLSQSDLRNHEQALGTVVNKLEGLSGVTIFRFDSTGIVRHPILAGVLERLEN
jgi:phosphate starvation-inducible protein PhoH and related proteins